MLQTKSLASTSFISGPEDDLATADVYDIKTDSVINKLAPVSFPIDDSVSAELAGGLSMASSLPVVSNPLLTGGSSLTASALLGSKSITTLSTSVTGAVSSAKSASGGLLSSLTAAGPSLLSRLSSGGLNGIPGLPAGGLTSLTSLLGKAGLPASLTSSLNAPIGNSLGTIISQNGISSKLGIDKIASSYQISSLINSIVGGATPISIVDKDSTSKLMSSLAGAGMSSGMPNAFSSVSSLAGGDKSILASAGTAALNFAASSGNIGGMKDVVTTVGRSALGPSANNSLTTVASNYRFTGGSTVENVNQSKQDFKDVTSTFTEVKGDWVTVSRTVINPADHSQTLNQPMIDLSVVNAGSSDFKSMMQQGAMSTPDPDLKYLSMAGMFAPSSPEQELQKSFPLTVTSIQTQSQPLTNLLPNTGSLGNNSNLISLTDNSWAKDIVIR